MWKLVTKPRLFLALIFFAAVAWCAVSSRPDGQLHVWFLDVGQGDAILIQAPDGRQILVDGGPSPSALLDQLGEVLPFWDHSLDLVVLTHPDADHVSGLLTLFERYTVTTVLDSVASTDKAAAPWLSAVDGARAARQPAVKGVRVVVGPAVMTVLGPPVSDALLQGNDRSVVLRLDFGQSSLLLTGDAEAAAEQAMLDEDLPLRADVLKIGHHGSSASTTAAFLAAVQPRLAIISVGADNRFGHPAPELQGRLNGIETLRTDQRGRIELVSDGRGWTVRCEK